MRKFIWITLLVIGAGAFADRVREMVGEWVTERAVQEHGHLYQVRSVGEIQK